MSHLDTYLMRRFDRQLLGIRIMVGISVAQLIINKIIEAYTPLALFIWRYF